MCCLKQGIYYRIFFVPNRVRVSNSQWLSYTQILVEYPPPPHPPSYPGTCPFRGGGCLIEVWLYVSFSNFSLSLTRWAQGYDGSPALFVNRDTICFVCGNNVKFINTKDKNETVLPSPGDGIGTLAVNPLYSSLAFAELKSDPKLFVYVYPDFSRPRATLEGEFLLSIQWNVCYTNAARLLLVSAF